MTKLELLKLLESLPDEARILFWEQEFSVPVAVHSVAQCDKHGRAQLVLFSTEPEYLDTDLWRLIPQADAETVRVVYPADYKFTPEES